MEPTKVGQSVRLNPGVIAHGLAQDFTYTIVEIRGPYQKQQVRLTLDNEAYWPTGFFHVWDVRRALPYVVPGSIEARAQFMELEEAYKLKRIDRPDTPEEKAFFDRVIEANSPDSVIFANPKKRYGDAKPPLGLFPSVATVYAAKVLQHGAEKYGAYNWRKDAVEAETYYHAVLRHINAWWDGETLDPESGLPHIAHALSGLAILLDADSIGMLIDNRPLPGKAAEVIKALTASVSSATSQSSDQKEH